MENVALNYERLIQFAKSLEGQTLQTDARKKEFQIRVEDNGLKYIPFSTGVPRTHGERWIQRVLTRYNETGSLRPGDYQDITVNGFYLLTIIGKLIARD